MDPAAAHTHGGASVELFPWEDRVLFAFGFCFTGARRRRRVAAMIDTAGSFAWRALACVWSMPRTV